MPLAAPGAMRSLLVLLASCGTAISSIPLNPPPHTLRPRNADDVELIASGSVTRPHVDVALFEAKPQSDWAWQVLDKLRQAAARYGCDALVIREAELTMLSKNQHVDATCVAYR